MNVFEDLIEELKEENLLEDTVIELASNATNVPVGNAALPEEPFALSGMLEAEPDISPVQASAEPSGEFLNDTSPVSLDAPADSELLLQGSDEVVSIKKPVDDRAFYNKRASAEVSSLQMVEHVLSAVEREYQKKLPKSYDDFNAKKALNAFLQVSGSITSDEHKQAEFALMQETEAWCSALSLRDREISVADLRRYSENCRPMLSSQAMLSLARFYRNLPYSEPVRGKFDFIITRLFSKPLEDHTRKLLFGSDEMLGHIKNLYADWSSLSLFSVDDPESNIKLAVLSFGDLTAEAESAIEFDELIKSDFFERLRLFKESIADLFYAPEVTAAAIECNVRIGNVYVELIDRERRQSNAASVHDKYSYLDDDTVSQATGKTLELIEILRERSTTSAVEDVESESDVIDETAPTIQPKKKSDSSSSNRFKFKLPSLNTERFGINKWVLATSIVLILVSVGIYVWANFLLVDPSSTAGVSRFDLQNSPFREDIKVAKISGETFYGVMLPSWETMPKEKQQELLQKIYQHGGQKEWLKVNLMNSQGRTVAYMSATRMEVGTPTP